ncbi:MAG: TolC family protein [Betaproteobacteria bacterium]|nr:TolC family protein [Betaproteobacteria bacterium]
MGAIPRSRLVRATPLLAALAVAGCALNQPPEREALRADALPSVEVPGAWASKGAEAGAVRDDWLATFADEQLRGLVVEALANNLDLRVAAAGVERAGAYAKQAGSTLYPQVNLLASGSFTGTDSGSAFETAGLFASWELDLWGRVRSQAAAGSAQYEVTAKDAEFARQSIAALVAKSWFLAIEARRQSAVAQDMVAAAESLAARARERQRIGKGDEYDVRLAQASLQGYRDAVLQLQLAERQASRAIETLVGRYPAGALEAATAFPAYPGPVPAGLPSELLERRLDVAAAERRVAAAYYLVGEAQAARLPRISLTASGSSITSDLVFLKNRDNPAWSAGGNLMLPLFAGGALQGQVEVRTAEQKAAVADYGRVGARAFSEVENALSAGFSLGQRVPVLEASVAENERALELAQVRYRVGTVDQRAVQQQLLAASAARSALARATGERLVQRVNLHLALGGSFAPVPQPEKAAAR